MSSQKMSSKKMAYLSQFKIQDEITSEDVVMMRRVLLEDSVISGREAAFLFDLNHEFQSQNPDWVSFFVEAVTDYCVNQVVPRGYLTEENMNGLLDMIKEDGHVDGALEMMLLVKILEAARQVPETLVMIVLEKVKEGILSGEGPLKAGEDSRAGIIDRDEVELLRRILYSAGGDANISISKAEAELLFELNAKSKEEENDPSWMELYTKAVTSYLMAANGYAPLAREEVIRRTEWLDAEGSDKSFVKKMWEGRSRTMGYMKQMLNFSGWSNTSEDVFEGMSLDRMEKAGKEAEAITEEEGSWLYSQITADGVVSDNEKEMIKYLVEMSDMVPENLKTLLKAA